jgi:ketosteroid isomerase-like protein
MPSLPDPIAAYFAAERAGDVDALARCFAPDASVRDERETRTGHAAIAAWMQAARAKYAQRSEPMSLRVEGDRHVVAARVSGTFPGSPLMIDHAFELTDGAIRALEIG